MSKPARTLARVSALPRPIDPSYPSNRLAVAGLLGSAAVSGLLLRQGWTTAARVGLGAFSAWAIARELDPDHSGSAALALGVVGAAALAGAPSLLGGMAAMNGTRVLSGTVGPAASLGDALALAGTAGISALGGGGSAALLPGAALLLSHRQRDRQSHAQGWTGPLALALGLLPAARGERARNVLSDVLSLAALGTAPVLLEREAVASRCDQASQTVSAQRLQLSRALALGGVLLGLTRQDSQAGLPLAGAALAVGLRRLFRP